MRTFDEGQVMTALCLWEAWLELESGTQPSQQELRDCMTQHRENHGSFTLRSAMINLVPHCDAAFETAAGLRGGEYDGSFDFDFVPDFLVGALDSGLMDNAIAEEYRPRPKEGVALAPPVAP